MNIASILDIRPDYRPSGLKTVADDEFVQTSTDYRWRGKIKCLHCPATGYGGSVATNNIWWGRYHGRNCSERGLFR